MKTRRDKTLHYRRAEWTNNGSFTFEECLGEAYRALNDVEDRTIMRANGQCIRWLKKREPHSGGIFVHIAADTPGEEASVIPIPKKGTAEADVYTASAPSDAEYMDADAFLYVVGNHVAICLTGWRESTVAQFIFDIFEKAELADEKMQFELIKVANTKTLAMLRKEGVKEIDLRASLFKATVEYENRKTSTSGILRAVGKHIGAIFKDEEAPLDAGLRVAVTISTDKRVRQHTALNSKRIQKMAVDVFKNSTSSDDFVIVTNAGNRIGSDDVSIREIVEIESQGKSVRRDKTWERLEVFFKRIRRDGFLEN